MKRLFFLALLFVFTSQINAQKSERDVMEYGKYALGFSPSALTNFYSAIQFSHDVRLIDRLAFTAETGYIYTSVYSNYATGFRFKPGLQFMIARSKEVAFTVGTNYLLRYSKSPRSYSVNFFQDFYSETVKVDREKIVSAGDITLSFIFGLTENLRLEIGAGLGAGLIFINDLNSTQKRIDDDLTFEGFNFNFYDRAGTEEFLVGSFNVNLSYILVK